MAVMSNDNIDSSSSKVNNCNESNINDYTTDGISGKGNNSSTVTIIIQGNNNIGSYSNDSLY